MGTSRFPEVPGRALGSVTGRGWTPQVVSRLTGALALAYLLSNFLYFGAISAPLGPPEPSAQRLLAWVTSHQHQLLFQFLPGYVAVLFAVVITLLVYLVGGRGVLATLAYVAVAANLAISLVGFGLYFGLWTYSQRGGSADSEVALASIAPTFTHSTLMAQGLAIGCVGLLAQRAQVWPAWLSWLLIIAGAEAFLTDIAFASAPSFSTTSTSLTLGGVARIFDLALGALWPIATGLVLLIRPVSRVAPVG